MAELLIEVYGEEIPARMQQKAMDDFKKIFIDFFNKQNIQFKEQDLQTFITPRRLVLLANNIQKTQITPTIHKIGPKINAPDKAIQGFLKSIAINDISKLDKINRENGQYYSYQQPESKINTATILEENLSNLLHKMSGKWSKSMDLIGLQQKQTWVRPIRNILAIFDKQILNFEFANLKANNQTFGHLLMGKKLLEITNFNDYKEQLTKNFVILDWFERRKIIADAINKLDSNLTELNSKLIDEISGLVEYPQILVGKINDEFINLPEEILQLTIKLHQKAILFKQNNSLNFIFVSNIKTSKKFTKKIISDNEKVIRARLSDAKFYIDEDLKIPFKDRTQLLKNIVFHKKLGSLYYKIKRLEILNKFIAIWVYKADLSDANKLADLAKNDLTTKTVAELPELQGIVGRYYAQNQGENNEICQAIAEQYLPNGQNSELPKTPLGIVLAISDKIDTICGLFLANEKPTASKDPFALRRAALGIIKILFDNKISLPLKIIINKAINCFPQKVFQSLYPNNNKPEITQIKKKLSLEIIQFFVERNKFYLKDQCLVKTDIINQIFENSYIDDYNKRYSPLLISQKAIFINQLMSNSSNEDIIELYKRATNIVAIAEKKDNKKYNGKVSIIALKNKYEKLLYKKNKIASRSIKKALKHNNYELAFSALEELKFPIKSFFNNVEINCQNNHLKTNRLSLLSKIKNLFEQILK